MAAAYVKVEVIDGAVNDSSSQNLITPLNPPTDETAVASPPSEINPDDESLVSSTPENDENNSSVRPIAESIIKDISSRSGEGKSDEY